MPQEGINNHINKKKSLVVFASFDKNKTDQKVESYYGKQTFTCKKMVCCFIQVFNAGLMVIIEQHGIFTKNRGCRLQDSIL